VAQDGLLCDLSQGPIRLLGKRPDGPLLIFFILGSQVQFCSASLTGREASNVTVVILDISRPEIFPGGYCVRDRDWRSTGGCIQAFLPHIIYMVNHQLFWNRNASSRLMSCCKTHFCRFRRLNRAKMALRSPLIIGLERTKLQRTRLDERRTSVATHRLAHSRKTQGSKLRDLWQR